MSRALVGWRKKSSVAVVAILSTWGSGALAEPYRLVQGDRVEITQVGQGDPSVVVIDLDGKVRLADVGGVTLFGLDMDAAEAEIEAAIESAGLFVDPSVTVSVIEYAPIVVAGDVSAPGRFPFFPGMTIGSALGVSGGSQTKGISKYEVDRARAEVEGQLRATNLDIAANTVRVARLEAFLADAETVTISPEQLAAIPVPASVPLDQLLATELDILVNARGRATDLLALWAEEISTIEAQQKVFAERIAVAEDVIANAAEELATAKDLQERGLQTASRLSTAEQREADARARALELEAARIAAARSIADAERQRTQFERTRREEALSQLQAARIELDSLRLAYGKMLEQQGILAGGSMGTMLSSDAVEVKFRLTSPREGRPGDITLSADTPLLPGDTLFVEIGVASLDVDG